MDENEIDEIWEVEFFGAYSHWVSEETYEMVKNMLMDITIDKTATGVEFKTIHGVELVILLSNISDLQHSTKKQRISGRETNKKYKEEWEIKKEAWE